MNWLDLLRPDPATRARRRIFEDILLRNDWGDSESVSGPGSNVARASLFRPDLEALIRELGARTLLDAPCGDFNWLSRFDLPIDCYFGVDIVPSLILRNRRRFRERHRRFIAADMVRDKLPRADLILCRDGLVHLSNTDVTATLKNFRRTGSRWLLTNTFISRVSNGDIPTGQWRPLNLEAPPFGLPPPVSMIDERCLGYDGQYRDKRLALWPLADLAV
jgi:hypothetical protein